MTITQQALDARAQIDKVINLNGIEVLEKSNLIQQYSTACPDLTRQCWFDHSMRVRRMLNVNPRQWKITEVKWAEEILAEIARLKRDTSDSATLALAVLGVRRKGLDQAIETLISEAIKAAVPEEVPLIEPGSKEDEEEALDPETKAALEALQIEVQTLR